MNKYYLCRLLAFLMFLPLFVIGQEGSIDRSFNYGRGSNYQFNYGYGTENVVNITSLQPDGKVIIGGQFTAYNGIARNYIARLNTDGSLDNNFDPGTGPNNAVSSIAIQSDGKIIIGGIFTTYNGTARTRIARLNNDGSLDNTFNLGTGANSSVTSISLQPDGKIIIGGAFTSFNGATRNNITRLNANGSLDVSFLGTGVNGTVTSTRLLPDGKIIIGGNFTTYDGTAINRLARLNADGSLDNTFNIGTGADNSVNSITLQSDDKIIIGGDFTSYNGNSINRLARLNADGSIDNTFDPGTGVSGSVRATSLQADGKIIIGGSFLSYRGIARIRIARVNSNGSLDNTFNIGTIEGNSVNSATIQPDGKIIIGGDFTLLNLTNRNHIARLNTDASLDNNFNPGTGASGGILSTTLQPDGKIIIGGFFNSYNGTLRNRIARSNADGSLDNTFNPGSGIISGSVSSTTLQPDGKIIIGGTFTSYSGTSINRIARLNANGNIDNTFNPGTGADSYVISTTLQPDGKIIIGGYFNSYNGTVRNSIARLNANGSLDNTFNPGTGANNEISFTTLQSDGKIIIGGNFTNYNGTNINRIARLNADGSLDNTFSPGTGANDIVRSITLQLDGKIIIGGDFTRYNGTTNNRIARLNADGSIDNTFSPGTGANDIVQSITLQPDGKILIGGNFTSYNSTTSNSIARLNADGSLDNAFVTGTGANGFIYSTTLQPDGNIIIGGGFQIFQGLVTVGITRIQGNSCVTPATPTVSGSPSFCSGGSTILTSSVATGNLWSNGATTQSITVTEAGNYSVRVISETCTSMVSDVVAVSIIELPTTPTISGRNTFCVGGSTILTSSVATGNLWSNGATTRSITVNTAGNYSVRVINGTCTSQTSTHAVVTMVSLPATPFIFSSNGISICTNETTTLSVDAADGYIWSNGATTPTITVGEGTYSVRTIRAEGCTSAVSGEIVITQQLCNQIFTGVGNLNSIGNWSTGSIPNTNTDVIIDGAITINSNYSMSNITINSTGSILIPAGITLTVIGNLANEGVITGLGTLLMAGANNQSVGGGSISNLTVANGETVFLSAPTSISGTLTLGSNTTFELNNLQLTLLSTATQTARLAAVPSGASLIAAGNFTVQRWLNPANVRRAANATGNYYLLGPVVQNQTVGLWNGVSPYGPETFNQANQSGSRFHFYNTALNAWRKPTSLNQALPAGIGAQVWFGTSAFFNAGRTTWSASGTPIVGNLNLPLTSGVSGFNLVSNPYPSTIDWDSPNWTKTGIANAIYIYDWVNQRYKSYVNGIGTNGGNRYLPTAQGFLVNATSGSAVLTATENIKVSNQVALQRTESQVNGIVRLQITNGTVTDEMVIANRSAATIAFEVDQDAQKMMNPTTNIFVSGAVNQSIATMNFNSVNSIPFVIQTNSSGSVTLVTTELTDLEGYTFNLFNEQTGELLPYTGTETYTFNVSANQPYRLQLRVGSVTGIENFKANVFEVYPNPATDKVNIRTNGTGALEIVNVVGQVVMTQPALATNEIDVSKLSKGVYTVRFNEGSKILVVK